MSEGVTLLFLSQYCSCVPSVAIRIMVPLSTPGVPGWEMNQSLLLCSSSSIHCLDQPVDLRKTAGKSAEQRCLCQNQPDAAHFPHVVDSMADPEASVRYLVYQFHPTSQMEHSQMEAIRPNWNLIIPSCPTFVANI
ncbi:hypothetical protein P7K49_026319 [Saguinus oedipus]|uniref:Uncharacterized protein n=1 Tax=Saguinus oedipus TaxID=9490 RepID=A0ABQ9UCT1_SAGOE|nr:hypothetical protein P7K49_026319 [Saguinus oedipus]